MDLNHLLLDLEVIKQIKEDDKLAVITLPGSKNEITHPFQKSVLNKYNSGNLAYGCTVNCEDDLVDLPDGIYKIKVYVCEGNKFSKEGHYLRTVLTELRLYKVIVNMNLECNPNSACINQIMHIKLLLEGAKADILFGNIKSAKAKFDKAVDLLEDLEHCDCKVDC